MRSLYEQTAPLLFAVAYRLLGNSNLAGEVVKKVYVDYWKHKDGIEEDVENNIRDLFVMTHRQAIQTRTENAYALPPRKPLPTDINQLNDAYLNGLDEKDQSILTSAYLDAVKIDDMAETFFIDPDDVRERLVNIVKNRPGGLS